MGLTEKHISKEGDVKGRSETRDKERRGESMVSRWKRKGGRIWRKSKTGI